MKSLICFIISLFICISCYAAPAMLDHQADYQPIIFIGEYLPGYKADRPARIYTTKRSLDMMLNLYEYNGKDWYMDIFVEYVGNLRETFLKIIKDNKQTTWLNTPSGSRVLWAVQYRTLSKNNKVTLFSPQIYYNDHGELLGECKIQDDVFDLSEYKNNNFGMIALNNVVVNFLNREYARVKNMNDGQPVK